MTMPEPAPWIALSRTQKKSTLRWIVRASALVVMLTSLGCQDLSGTAPLPAGMQGPEAFQTASGAMEQARGAGSAMTFNFAQIIGEVGIFTDEMTELQTSTSTMYGGYWDSRRWVEHRQRPNGLAYTYAHLTRGQARLARAALVAYAPSSPPALQALMYALEGYAEILLAEHYCSGIPLSTIDFPSGVTVKAGSTTAEVFQHAAMLLDSAILLAVGNDSITSLARIGLGRALMGLKLYDSAASVVASVQDTFVYRIYQPAATSGELAGFPVIGLLSSVSDREGENGLPYISSHDPRTMTMSIVANPGMVNQFSTNTPIKYRDAIQNRSLAMVLASGVEARLIMAEADLARGGSQWLAILNQLRTSGTINVTVRTDVPGVSPGPAGYPDTTWSAGTGVGLIASSVVADMGPVCPPTQPCMDTAWYRGLRPLSDPGVALTQMAAAVSRVDLIFRERAFWLFLTGHRQGDLRRLIRQYGRDAESVFPTGVYNGKQLTYGTDVVLRTYEELSNPLYKGCFHYGA